MANAVFLSFDPDDADLVSTFLVLAQKADPAIEFADWSIKGGFGSAYGPYLRDRIRERLAACSALVCLIGEQTWNDACVTWEIQAAAEMGKGLVGVRLPQQHVPRHDAEGAPGRRRHPPQLGHRRGGRGHPHRLRAGAAGGVGRLPRKLRRRRLASAFAVPRIPHRLHWTAMLDALSERLQGTFRRLGSRGKISESDLDEALGEVRRALLEADVNFQVVRDFIARVRERALGADVMQSITPGQQVIGIVHQQLVEVLGGDQEPLRRADSGPTTILVCGLKGSGKTTLAGASGPAPEAPGPQPAARLHPLRARGRRRATAHPRRADRRAGLPRGAGGACGRRRQARPRPGSAQRRRRGGDRYPRRRALRRRAGGRAGRARPTRWTPPRC